MTPPIGVIADSTAVLFGGIVGSLFGAKIPEQIRSALPDVFSLAAFCLAISGIIKMNSPAVVVLALLTGFVIGKLLNLERLIHRWGKWTAARIAGAAVEQSGLQPEQFSEKFTVAVILFCAGSLNVYGAVVSAVSGDHSILIAKSVLDFFTAVIFATTIGYSVAFLSVVQFGLMLLFYIVAAPLSSWITPQMFQDFSCCGGLILFSTAFRMAGIKSYSSANMLPALVVVMPLSFLWGLLGI